MLRLMCLLAWLVPVVCPAQDSTYIRSYVKQFVLSTRVGLRGQAFQYRARGLDNTLDYVPNVAATVSLNFNYKWLGLGVGIRLPESAINEGRGNTEQFDIQLNSYGRRIGFDLYYLDYSGFYLSNTRRALGTLPSGARFYLRPDIANLAYGGNVYYVFNHEKFSYRSVFIFNERQLRTAGSWLLQANVANFVSDADSAFVPTALSAEPDDPQVADVNYIRFLQAGVLGGYGLNLVVKKRFYGSLSLLLGGALLAYRAEGEKGDVGQGERLSGRALLRGGAGYSGERWFWGANTLVDTYNFRYSRDLLVSFFVTQLRFFVGYRFKWKLF